MEEYNRLWLILQTSLRRWVDEDDINKQEKSIYENLLKYMYELERRYINDKSI